MKIIRFILLIICFNTQAVERFSFESITEKKLFEKMTKELRCPKCQNSNIDQSDSQISIDLKNKTYELVKEGYSEREIKDYMKDRYGDFVLYNPDNSNLIMIVKVLPFILIILSLVYLILTKRKNDE